MELVIAVSILFLLSFILGAVSMFFLVRWQINANITMCGNMLKLHQASELIKSNPNMPLQEALGNTGFVHTDENEAELETNRE